MAIITLFHGSPYESVTPEYGLGNDKHDYGRGFYLTANVELAKEWAVCRPDESNGWVHQYELDTNGLRILDFQEHSVLTWLAELMKHRDAADSKRYRVLATKFIAEYGIDTSGYDIIKGWRANASYFYIAKEFVRDNVDVDIWRNCCRLEVWASSIASRPQRRTGNCAKSRTACFPSATANSTTNTIRGMLRHGRTCATSSIPMPIR